MICFGIVAAEVETRARQYEVEVKHGTAVTSKMEEP